MMFLVDTNVISETRKPAPHGGVVAWLSTTQPRQIYLSAVTIGELQAGIELTRKTNRTKAQEIESWLEQLAEAAQILPADDAVFREFARLMSRKSKHLEFDALIAATARIHDLTVVTRNIKDFRDFEVRVLDPFQTPYRSQ